MKLMYVTSNMEKFNQAKNTCQQFGIELVQDKSHDFQEIQSESGEEIALHKAAQAYALFKQPLVISDDSWDIPGLGGFPGSYMKSINQWFTSDDWLRLTKSLTDRRIILHQVVVYQDADGSQVFVKDLMGTLQTKSRGISPYAHATITSLDGGKTTTAEWHERGESASGDLQNPWHDFAKWYRGHTQ
jgi:XTP/dITP diphosphohydrolase